MEINTKEQGKIFAFHGGKQGEGKSFIAQNLATVFALREKKSVLVFDLDSQTRQHHFISWGMKAEPALIDIAGHLSRFDEQTIKGYFPANKENVTVVGLAKDEQEARGISSQQILKALQLFKHAYDVVIIDGLQGWERLVLDLLDISDLIIMVCSPDLIGLKQERENSLHYQELKFPFNKIKLILNRYNSKGALTSMHLEKTLPGHKIYEQLPIASQAIEAINLQQSVVQLYSNDSFGKAVRKLAGKLLLEKSYAQVSTGEDINVDKKTEKAMTDISAIKERIHRLVLDHGELKAIATKTGRSLESQKILREKVGVVVTSLVAIEAPELINRDEREQLVREVVDEALGLGPLEDFIRDDSVTEIMVNHSQQIYIEKNGKLILSNKHFLNDKQLMTVIERIVAPLGRRIDESQPYVDARLADGSRVNAIIPPLALKGPSLTIRKFSKKRLVVDDLINFGSLPKDWAEFLGVCVKMRKNIVVAGGTGSGKTTLLNIVSSFISKNERIITVEDAAELNLPQPHVITLESRPVNIEGKGAISIRDLVKNCLRMRPDRIIVGECRGGEALDMLQAMNTGHDGSLTTIHANSPQDTVSRLETMVLMSGMDLPLRAIREQIASAVDIIVQQLRLPDGSRKITKITEVIGIKDNQVELKDIFVFKQTGLDKENHVLGEFYATGFCPTFVDELKYQGVLIDQSIFKKRRP